MAAASVQLSPHVAASMAGTRRAPLSMLPNAGNSPFRGGAAQASGLKRTRPAPDADSLAATTTSVPPAKKHIVDAGPVTPNKARAAAAAGGNTTPLQRRHAARVREPTRPAAANAPAPVAAPAAKQETHGDSMERLRVWQRHNEKAFPAYVFYFESVPDAVRRDCSKDLKALGAREAQFFSREVTHVVTTRSLPTDDQDAAAYADGASNASQHPHDKTRLKTINPSLLEKNSTNPASTARGKFTFEASLTRKMLAPSQDAENRRPQPVDMLQKAKEMGIRIWHLDKLQRILDVMFDDGISSTAPKARVKTSSAMPKAQPVHQDLQALIRNEEVHGPSEQELKLLNDVIALRGPYLYIRCVNEKVKPIMVRQWPAVEAKEDGEWPQFRSVSPGKCPFVPEDVRPRRFDEETRVILEEKARREAKERQPQHKDLGHQLREGIHKARKPSQEEVPTLTTAPALKQSGSEPLPVAVAARDFKTPLPHQRPGHSGVRPPGGLGAEPMASGMQASNITSAIRSQMISSTAAGPGVKAGTSREIHGLQRKILERGGSTSSAPAVAPQQQSQPSALTRSHAMANLAGDAAGVQVHGEVRSAKQKAQEKLHHPMRERVDVEEEATSRPPSRDSRTGAAAPPQRPVASKPARKKELKPGYCENCREKFDDFDEHTLSKRHRKFAATRENWKDLDRLLSVLDRPLLHEGNE